MRQFIKDLQRTKGGEYMIACQAATTTTYSTGWPIEVGWPTALPHIFRKPLGLARRVQGGELICTVQ